MADSSPHIGTLKEAPLHAAIKEWYRRDGDLIEVPLDGFVIDLVRDDLLVEIPTKGFSAMKRKLTALLHSGHRVRIVYPIAVDKWIVKVDADGAPISRRRSPKHGGPIDLFSELVSVPRLINEAGLELEALLTTQEERRAHTPGKSWRRQGWSVVERSLVDVV